MFITHSPCFNCAKTIIASGISKVYYLEEYDNSQEVVSFLEENKIQVFSMNNYI
ncbi:hypothetical protein FPHOBKDP_00006 [Listeria phage LPJP1]|nr:hypothetical protein FPHOBKDP_00006 [Listeria phage LPJP1]